MSSMLLGREEIILNKNILLAFGITILFIGIAISPVISAVDKDIDVGDESIDNSDEIGTSDEYEEIITFIKGFGFLNWINKRGYFRGEVNITIFEYGGFNLSGYRWSNGSIEYFNEFVIFVYAYRFIGYSSDYWSEPLPPFVRGIALGNIEWEK